MSSSDSDRAQSVRNGWINALRAEVLRSDLDALPRVAHVGFWIATYADADGGNAFPGRETLARLAGCSQETVTRAVKVLMAIGMLQRVRRPNASSVYQLVIPIDRPDWAAHIHLYTDTRQRRAHAAQKKREAEARTATPDAVRTASMAGVPDSDAGRPPDGPDSVHGRPRTATPDAVRTASMAGVYQYPSTSGRDPLPDHTPAGLSPQPQDACARALEEPPVAQAAPTLRTVPAPPGGRPAKAAKANDSSNNGQMPLLVSVRTPQHVTEDKAQLRATATPDDIRRAVTELGRGEAIDLYGWRLVGPVLNELDSDTGS